MSQIPMGTGINLAENFENVAYLAFMVFATKAIKCESTSNFFQMRKL